MTYNHDDGVLNTSHPFSSMPSLNAIGAAAAAAGGHKIGNNGGGGPLNVGGLLGDVIAAQHTCEQQVGDFQQLTVTSALCSSRFRHTGLAFVFGFFWRELSDLEKALFLKSRSFR